MDDDAPGDVSLSMIDVITNGLASLLVLLFLLLLLKGQVTWAARSVHGAQRNTSTDDPLVILVTSDSPEPLFAAGDSPWQIEADPAIFAREHGPRYAAAYFRRPPSAGERVRLKLPQKLAGCHVEVVAAGRALPTPDLGPDQAGQTVQLWPREEIAP
jgi:hypothetical protein